MGEKKGIWKRNGAIGNDFKCRDIILEIKGAIYGHKTRDLFRRFFLY